MEREQGKLIPCLFHDPEGNPLAEYYQGRDYWKPTRYFRQHWNAACKAAGLVGRRPHDFRRTGIRRFGDMGIDDAVGMKLSGHKTTRIYFQYKAVGNADLIAASEKLSGGKVHPKKARRS